MLLAKFKAHQTQLNRDVEDDKKSVPEGMMPDNEYVEMILAEPHKIMIEVSLWPAPVGRDMSSMLAFIATAAVRVYVFSSVRLEPVALAPCCCF